MPKFRWIDYVRAIELGDQVSRMDLAQYFGVGRSTATYHLERAVDAGHLHKQYGFTGKQSGWLYSLPETTPRLEGM